LKIIRQVWTFAIWWYW